jgi:DNA-binding GntR family transcriptional regulator
MRIVRQTEMPISWLELYVEPRFADVLELPNPMGQPALMQIERHHGHRALNAQVEIFATRIDEELAEPLQAEAGAPAMAIMRRYRGGDGNVYLVTYSIHPENRFSLNFEFERLTVAT